MDTKKLLQAAQAVCHAAQDNDEEPAYSEDLVTAIERLNDVVVEMKESRTMEHAKHAERAVVATPCTAHHVNYGGGCLNCGWKLVAAAKAAGE